MTLRRSFWGVLILLILSAAAAYFTPLVSGTPTPVFFTRLVYLCLLLLGLGWLWAYFSIRGFSLLREARVMRQQVGEVFEERFKVSNRFPFLRLWIEIRDESAAAWKNWIAGAFLDRPSPAALVYCVYPVEPARFLPPGTDAI